MVGEATQALSALPILRYPTIEEHNHGTLTKN